MTEKYFIAKTRNGKKEIFRSKDLGSFMQAIKAWLTALKFDDHIMIITEIEHGEK